MFSFVRCVEPKDVGIGTWPLAGLPRWSSMASKWPPRRFQLLTALQSNVPAKRSFRSTGRAPMPPRLYDQRCWKLHCAWTHNNTGSYRPRVPRCAPFGSPRRWPDFYRTMRQGFDREESRRGQPQRPQNAFRAAKIYVSASPPIPIAGRVHAWHTQLSNSCWPASSNWTVVSDCTCHSSNRARADGRSG